MKTTLKKSILLPSAILLLAVTACTKEAATTSDSLYVPTSSDVTSTASLDELQQGRTLYISNCASCHSLYLPESYSAARWRSILPTMTPRTSLSSTQVALVTKYLTKGK
ncbi:MAG: hypothetical protein IPH88_18160 [Bacteroidales bacterium]|nr:hypothetical protein [Bacteroidales bacterium]